MTQVDNQIWYTCGYKYQLSRDYTTLTAIHPEKRIETDYIILTTDGYLTAKKGYAWDGPSGPTVDDDTNMRGSVAHDVKYQLMRLQLISYSCRKLSDQEMKDDLGEDGMGWVRREGWYYGLRLGGSASASPLSTKIVRVSPERV
ncbi:MAG: hypothetical protein WC148_03500 [Bacilli bacterium]